MLVSVRGFWCLLVLVVPASSVSDIFRNGRDATTETTTLTVEEFHSGLLCDYFDVVVDVRTRDEWDEGHIEGGILVESLNLFGMTGEVGKPSDIAGCEDCRVAVYCNSGARAAVAAKILADAGFSNIYNGLGVSQWSEAGNFLVKATQSAIPMCKTEDNESAFCRLTNNLSSFCEDVSVALIKTRQAIRRLKRRKRIVEAASSQLLRLVPKQGTSNLDRYCQKLSRFVSKAQSLRGEGKIPSAFTAKRLKKYAEDLMSLRDCSPI